MRRFILFLFVLASYSITAQDMNNQKLGEIITKAADTVQGQNGRWQFMIEDIVFFCITDENNNRMRIISPVIEVEKLDEELLKNALVANFHTALDVKYAISDELLWSVFIHPLKELTADQAKDAISQVYYANATFGLTYSSTSLVFPGNTKKKEKKEEEIKKTKI